MRMVQVRWILILPLVAGLYACSQLQDTNPSSPSVASFSQNGAQAGKSTPLTAVVKFGKPNTGSPFPPPSGHDQSGHARDSLTPGTVVIDATGSVRFELPPDVHQIAIYDNGKGPGDVNTNALLVAPNLPSGCPPVPLINDSVMRLAFQTHACFQPWSYTHTFPTAGKYLVICTFLPHFQVGMYGWVTVRNRG
jgi:plastocyanin